jgi:hypothetical protein
MEDVWACMDPVRGVMAFSKAVNDLCEARLLPM